MDKRLLLAILLTVVVWILIPIIFPTPTRLRQSGNRPSNEKPVIQGNSGLSARATSSFPSVDSNSLVAAAAKITPETILVVTPQARYQLSSVGAIPVSVQLTNFQALTKTPGFVELARARIPLLRFRLAIGRDTIALDRMHFVTKGGDSTVTSGTPLTFQTVSPTGQVISLTYTFLPDGYTTQISGSVQLAQKQYGVLLITIPTGLRSEEADTTDDQRNLAYVYKPARNDAEKVSFSSLDPGENRTEEGPLTWIASKNKYFLVVLLAKLQGPRFASVVFTGGQRMGKIPVNAAANVAFPLGPNGQFAFDLYTGPQEWKRLRALGRNLDQANPYGGFLNAIVQPFAGLVIQSLLWLHNAFSLSYGWVLVVFAIGVRILLWPLNQKAMRASIRMQRLQPELQVLQKKYKNNPEKQQTEVMKLYKEHGMSPFSAFSGCLPVLLPWPVLIALFFVFQNTIEFRGVSFFYLDNISLKDPFYILPLLMAASMFALSWISMRGMPPSTQTKTLMYVMPVAMTVLFLKVAAGLNLYYFVQNLAALPQQWLITRERRKATDSRPG